MKSIKYQKVVTFLVLSLFISFFNNPLGIALANIRWGIWRGGNKKNI